MQAMQAAIFLCVVGSTAFSTAHGQVAWREGSVEEALKRARVEKRWVLVDVFAGWCGPCHEMDEKVFARPEVAAALGKGWVAVRRDGEAGEGAELAKRYHVVGFPTLLLLKPDGSEVDRIMGFIEAKELLATLASFRAGKNTLAALEKRAAAAREPALVAELARRHALRGDERAPAEAEEVVAADAENRAGRAAEALYVLGKYYWLRGKKDWKQALATFDRLVKVFPKSPQAGDVPYQAAIAHHGLGDDAKAIQVLDGWLAGGKDAERYNAYAWCCFQNKFGRARAIAVAKEGLAAFPRADALWDTYGELLAQDGKPVEAAAAERKALEIKPGDKYYAGQLERFGGKGK